MTTLLLAFVLAAEPPIPVKKEEKPAPKKSSLFKKKSEAASTEPKADEKPPAVPDRSIPKPDDAPKKGSALDEELSKGLEKSLGHDDEEDPLLRAGQRMRTVEEQLAKADVGGQTIDLQLKIVADLNELLKRARQNNSKQNQQKQQQQQQQKQDQQQQQQQQAQQQQNQQQQQNKANDARADARVGRATKEELAKMREQRDVWGHLPELERQLMQQSFKDEMLPEYRAALEKYYKKLAEQAASKDK